MPKDKFGKTLFHINIGYLTAKNNTEKSGHKEAFHYFKYAIYLFDFIKEEALFKISEKELSFDLF